MFVYAGFCVKCVTVKTIVTSEGEDTPFTVVLFLAECIKKRQRRPTIEVWVFSKQRLLDLLDKY